MGLDYCKIAPLTLRQEWGVQYTKARSQGREERQRFPRSLRPDWKASNDFFLKQ